MKPFSRLGLLACTLACFCTSAALGQLPPAEALKTLRPADGLHVSLFASEPLLTNPSCLDVDTHGRVWIAEIQFYRWAAKNPPADKIKVLEDTDGDGIADKATVFADGLFAPMSLCVCGNRAFAFVGGKLLMWEDKNGDLKADGPPAVLATGFSPLNHDHTAHSIVVGPDHKWYMAHGDRGFQATGSDGSKIRSTYGAIVRGELDGSKLEVVAYNFRNPYEVCISSFGELFCSDNDGDGSESVRICWILEGGNYGWNGAPPFRKRELDAAIPKGTPFREAWHFRGNIPGYVPGTLVTGFGSPTGICFYEGNAFPNFKNTALHTDCGPRVLRTYRHQPVGAGMRATSQVWLTNAGDNYFRPDDICTGPDGSLFISDWYDGGVGGHDYNNPLQGRIYRVQPTGTRLVRADKPGPYTNAADAIAGLKSPNLDTQFLAREYLLATGQGSVPALQALLSDNDPDVRARALWVLDRIGGPARTLVVEQLHSQDASFRALAVRILRRHGDAFASQILPLAKDANGEVRREVILACGKLSGDEAFRALVRLAATYDGSDRYLLEAIHIAAGAHKEKLYAALAANGSANFAALPLLQLLNPSATAALVVAELKKRDVDARAMTALIDAAGNIPSAEAGRSLTTVLEDPAVAADLRSLALGKLRANLGGSWAALAAEPATLNALKAALATPELCSAALTTIGDRALAPLAAEVLALATDAHCATPLRQQAIQIGSTLDRTRASAVFRKLLGDADPAIRQTAINAIVDGQNRRILRDVFIGDQYSADIGHASVARLMQSTGGALLVLRAIDAGETTPDLKAMAIAAAAKHPDANVRLLFEKYIPAEQLPKKLGTTIQPQDILALSGDPARGEQIFNLSSAAQCMNCHIVHGRGNDVGPELSQIGRKYDRAALLETILQPSKSISHDYRPYMLESSEGQVYVGFLVEKSDQFVAIKDITGKVTRFPAEEVEALVEQQKSLMPELVLQEVSAQDAADLLAFLMTLNESVQQVTSYRVLGPFSTENGQFDAALPPEADFSNPDWNAQYRGASPKPMRWEIVRTVDRPLPGEQTLAVPGSASTFPCFDTVKYDIDRGYASDKVAHYAAFCVETSASQEATLQLGSDDGVKVWVNGEALHRQFGTRALAPNQDAIKCRLEPGRNVVVCKVINGTGAGGLTVNLRAPEPFELSTE